MTRFLSGKWDLDSPGSTVLQQLLRKVPLTLPLSFLALGAAPPPPLQEGRAAQPQGPGGLGRSLGALLLLLGTQPAPRRWPWGL